MKGVGKVPGGWAAHDGVWRSVRVVAVKEVSGWSVEAGSTHA